MFDWEVIGKKLGNKYFLATKRLKARSSKKEILKAQEWFDRNYSRIDALFSKLSVRSIVFEGLEHLWPQSKQSTESDIRNVISQVAVANALIAGLPGKLGVGVFVCMALEAYMALRIANFVGIKVKSRSDIWKYIALGSGITLTILFVFRHLLSFAYSLFSFIPFLPPLVAAEFIVTNFVGTIFWVGFENAKETGEFSVTRSTKRILSLNKELLGHQGKAIRKRLTYSWVRDRAKILWKHLSGDIVSKEHIPKLRGEAFVACGIAYLVIGKTKSFDGPIGELFIQSIRDRWPQLQDQSVDSIGNFMKETYEAHQLHGVHSLIKGKLFERLVEAHENADGDNWKAHLHDDQSYPGSDIVFYDDVSGETLEVSLKATDNSALIEHALLKYPDIPILATSEVADEFDNVTSSVFSNEYVSKVTQENYEQLVSEIEPLETTDVLIGVSAGVGAASVATLWPFFVAYCRGIISYAQFRKAVIKALPNSGAELLTRITLAAFLGPIYGWYVLARFGMALTPVDQVESAQEQKEEKFRKMSWNYSL
tara:strand:+ start:211 stop:1827 length:1617 start_codon:yes stop_codon:yes gene_type:complete